MVAARVPYTLLPKIFTKVQLGASNILNTLLNKLPVSIKPTKTLNTIIRLFKYKY